MTTENRLSFGNIIKIDFGSITLWAGTGVQNIALRTLGDRTYFLSVTFFEVRNQLFVSPVLTEIDNEWESVNFEFMILWGMGIIKSPMFESNMFANKVN